MWIKGGDNNNTMCFKKIDTRHFRRRGRNNQRNATKIDIQHNQPMPQMTVNISNINVKNKCCEAELKKKVSIDQKQTFPTKQYCERLKG